jgi:hypothetical protein
MTSWLDSVQIQRYDHLEKEGAGGRNRTDTGLPPRDFEDCGYIFLQFL